jgi:formylglycine-generating enzyme required for sulfatase activity
LPAEARFRFLVLGKCVASKRERRLSSAAVLAERIEAILSPARSATNATVVSSRNPAVYGEEVTFTATATAQAPAVGTPTGTVTFRDGSNDLGNVALSGGTARLKTASLGPGSHDITVRYGGERGFLESTSATLTQFVNPAHSPLEQDMQEALEDLAGPTELPPPITNSVGMKLVLIPPGTFLMGSPEKEKDRSRDEGPPREVEITQPFYLGIYPVTQRQYEQVMGANPSHFWEVPGQDTSRFPVERVSWEEAVEFCKKLSDLPEEKRCGRVYRLPTEAEWEYSCRGGARSSTPFHHGSSLSSTQANFDGRYPYGGGAEGPYLGRTTPVGSYKPNAWGLFDLHGNVWEWCSDWFDAGYYKQSPRQDPPGPPEGSHRVRRGGCWRRYGRYCRSACRGRSGPAIRYSRLGFRVALVLSRPVTGEVAKEATELNQDAEAQQGPEHEKAEERAAEGGARDLFGNLLPPTQRELF